MLSCSDSQECIESDDTPLVLQDLHNKQQELNILRELYVAQQNNDEESLRFFLSEYIRVPRLKLTDKQKQHPMYKEWITDETIKSGEFMHARYDYR